MAKQVKLRKNNEYQVLWLVDGDQVKKGDRVTLKGDDTTWWDVVETYQPIMEKTEINRNWHVGGL